MALTNDSIIVAPAGSGATVATHAAGGKEHQAVVMVDAAGHIVGSRDSWSINIASQVHVASANTVHWDIFNADASVIVRVLSIRQIPDMVTAVTGVAFAWQLQRTTAVGTGGTTLTPWSGDTTQTALDTDITARSKPTGGATAGTTLRDYQLHSEETNTGSIVAASMGGYELLPDMLVIGGGGLVLRQNQGLRCVQVTNSAAGNTGWLITFTTE